jgi:3-oxoacyl-[acyl-carrier protein] reductase
MDLKLKGMAALATAASKGIGAAAALALAREGVRVVITSSSRDNLAAARARIREATGADVTTHVIDVTDPEAVEVKATAIVEEMGGIDILVANGPGPKPIAAVDADVPALRAALDTNLVSVLALTRAVLPGMTARKFGRIIALASTTGREPDAGLVLSNVARAGVLAYIKTLSREVAKHGITANTILTGGVLTERTETLLRGAAAADGSSYEKTLAQAVATIPSGYIATPEQFVPMLVFLASPLSEYVNGVNLPVDGGFMRAI